MEGLFVVAGLFCFLFWMASIIGAGYVAAEKGRSVTEGILLGAVFGPLGMLTEAGLPEKQPAAAPAAEMPVKAAILPEQYRARPGTFGRQA
jgi:hypothetical protein